MYANCQKGPQGVQNDRASGSKVTNLRRFQPYWGATEKIYHKYEKRFKNRSFPFVRVERTHDDFIFPASGNEIQVAISRIPLNYLRGIKAILVPPGSNKQLKVAKALYIYGEYWMNCIFLHPYPKRNMLLRECNHLRPHELESYNRAGAVIGEDKDGITISFNENALKAFYLCDVLMHEIGHHIDTQRRPQIRREKFAEWFALEYGYRLQE